MPVGWADTLRQIAVFAVGFGVILLVIERCTVLNVTSPVFLRSAQLDDAPLLKDAGGTVSHAMTHIGDPYVPTITYDPIGEVFIVVGRDIMTFDQAGRKAFAFTPTNDSQLIPFSHFIVTPDEVYDLSRAEPVPEPVVQVINGSKDTTFTLASWQREFGEAYAKADMVIMARNFRDLSKQPSFMRIDGQWILFYSSSSDVDIEMDWDLGVTIPGFPAKMDHTILLKDPSSGQYAANSDPLRDGEVALPEDSLNYAHPGRLTTVGFDKTYVSENIVYTPIPMELAGPAWHRLEIGDESVVFRETGARAVFGAFESKLSWFVPPEPHGTATGVSFLSFRPLNNIDTEGSDGLYIIHPR